MSQPNADGIFTALVVGLAMTVAIVTSAALVTLNAPWWAALLSIQHTAVFVALFYFIIHREKT